MSKPSFPTFRLPSGDDLPAFGLGCWQSKPGEVANAVEVALKAGYPLIDGAAIYGNEKEVGEGIRASGVDRKDIWVTTKLWNTMHRPEDVPKALDRSLADMGLEYVDLYLMHYPCAMDPDTDEIKVIDVPFTDTWKAMEALLETGKCRNIGVSNFCKSEMERLLASCTVKPQVHQFERHPYLPQDAFVAFHKEHDIHVTAYSPLGNTNPLYAKDDKLTPIVQHPVIQHLAAKHGCTPANILISLQIKQGHSVVPKSVTPSRILENMKVVELTDEDVEAISGIKERKRYADFSDIIGYRYYSDLDDTV